MTRNRKRKGSRDEKVLCSVHYFAAILRELNTILLSEFEYLNKNSVNLYPRRRSLLSFCLTSGER